MNLSPTIAMLLSLLSALAGCGSRAPEPASPLTAESCCREFDYVLEVTIFKIDVVRLNLRIDPETARRVAALTRSGDRTPGLEDSVAAELMQTPSAEARMTFLRGMSGQQFLDNTVATLHRLGEEGLLSSAEVEALDRSARTRFAFLDDSGIAAGDYLGQVLRGDTVTTNFLTLGGQQLMRDVQVGSEHRTALLGSYFARASDFRNGLLEQMFVTE